MKNKFTIVCSILGLLSGCAEINSTDLSATKNNVTEQNSKDILSQNSEKSNSDIKNSILASMLHLTFEENYFMRKGQTFQLMTPEKKTSEYTIDSDPETQSSDSQTAAVENNTSSPSDSHKISSNRAYVKCYYLGNLKGKHVIFRRYNSGGSGIFTDVIVCSVEKEKLRIDDVVLLGDRTLDGIIDCPHLGYDGNLYFQMRSSISTVATISGITAHELAVGPCQAAQDFWNTSKCVYNPSTKNLNIISMDINLQNEISSSTKKMLSKIFPNHETTIHIDENQMPEFLKKFKSAYKKMSQQK